MAAKVAVEMRSAFLRGLASGLSEREALEAAGYEPNTPAAMLALTYYESTAGQAELAALEEGARALRGGRDRTSEDVVFDLRSIYARAIEAGDLKSALRALELEGKHRGTFAEKIEVSGKVDLVGTILAARKRATLDVGDVVDVEPAESDGSEFM